MESSFESVAWLATACAEILAGLAGPQPGPRPSRPTPSVAPAGAPAPLRSYDGVESLPLLSRARHRRQQPSHRLGIVGDACVPWAITCFAPDPHRRASPRALGRGSGDRAARPLGEGAPGALRFSVGGTVPGECGPGRRHASTAGCQRSLGARGSLLARKRARVGRGQSFARWQARVAWRSEVVRAGFPPGRAWSDCRQPSSKRSPPHAREGFRDRVLRVRAQGRRRGAGDRRDAGCRCGGGGSGGDVAGLPAPVGTALAGRPPDRSRRADFPHRAPTLGQRAAKRASGHG
jgi:hypothetical protein